MIFNWTRMGRAFVAKFGHLSVSVRCIGSACRGDLQWRVDDVFGNPFLGSGWTDLDSAKAEAEKIALREARALARHVEGKDGG